MTLADDLAERLNSSEGGLDAATFVALLTLLVEGSPVEIPSLAAAVGVEIEELRARLAAAPDTEYDAAGRIVGSGLTLRPTPHRFAVDGHDSYAWCALDTLFFPALLGRTAQVESASPTSGAPVSLTVAPEGITDVEPVTAVMSVLDPGADESIRNTFFNEVHFFTGPEEASGWLSDRSESRVIPAEAHAVAADLVTVMDEACCEATSAITDKPPADCCTRTPDIAGEKGATHERPERPHLARGRRSADGRLLRRAASDRRAGHEPARWNPGQPLADRPTRRLLLPDRCQVEI
jgi:alkylmercury lyase